jgi:glutaredoxin
MRTSKIIGTIVIVSSCLVVFPSFVSAVGDDTIETTTTTTIDDEEPTCFLDTTTSSDCSTTVSDDAVQQQQVIVSPTMSTKDLIGQVVSLTDDSFDELTTTHIPSTWLVMFKTNACGICKKALPVLEALSIDTDILEHNNREARKSIKTLREEAKLLQEGEIPSGPIYEATIDAASWSSSDITKRFDIEATPTIILIRNEGYSTSSDKHHSNSNDNIDSRSYYIYKEQRAIYPLRKFVLGEFIYRKRYTIPPVLSIEERKVRTILGQIEYYLAPGIKWAGGIIGKLLLVWFIFIGGLGLFLRVHNYAWGDKEGDGDDEVTNRRAQQEKEIEIEKAKGRKEWEEKEKARKANYNGDDNEEDEMKGKGVSVKKTGATPRNVTRLANPRKSKVK